MTAQPIDHHGAPCVPNTVKGIRDALPAKLRPAFQAELLEAIDSDDMTTAVDAVKGTWWAQAVWHVDPSVREAFAALDRGDTPLVPSPFADR